MKEPKILLGKPLREKLLEHARADCRKILAQLGPDPPKLVAVRVGGTRAGDLYVASQKKICGEVGALHEEAALPEKSSTTDVGKAIEKLNEDPSVDGVIVNLPLPKHLDPDLILACLDPEKDVEGVLPHNLGLLLMNKPSMRPCTPAACVELIKSAKVDLYGKEVVVVGASISVGKPLSVLLLDQMATVTICRSSASKVGSLEEHVRRADVLVAALGEAEAIRGAWIKRGAVVIDVGINQVNGKTVGDVEFEAAKERAGAITPVPGGVGPVTSAILMQNLMRAARAGRQKGH